MHTAYRAQLESHVQRVIDLERSGYGSTYRRDRALEDRETYKTAGMALVAVLAWSVLIVLASV